MRFWLQSDCCPLVLITSLRERKSRKPTLTSDFKLAVLSGAEDRVSQAEPWQLFAELRQEIVGNEAYDSSQDVQDEAESRLWYQSRIGGRGGRREGRRRWRRSSIKNPNMYFPATIWVTYRREGASQSAGNLLEGR